MARALGSLSWFAPSSLAVTALLAPGCASAPPEPEPQPAATIDPRTEHELEVTRALVQKAEMEARSFDVEASQRVSQAKAKLDMAKRELNDFLERAAPHRLAEARLRLQEAKDSAQEAAEELEQIELMYEGQDLDDRTAEFVVQRGRRHAERQAEWLKLEEQALVSLERHELPLDKMSLELAIQEAESEFAAAQREREIGQLEKKIAVLEAEGELAELGAAK